ncbi:hypothetical protein BU23DRAFT_634144 [Bimuria novae-zelandiae CBS 107.79]|uniref:ASST-domain-containing protein n=1 Tax=Bimuria novae-zelandiae CBS 107.79 TaxID=1447943 RepID=A0A6A5VPB0_9PLEO|nr:hypothetical protein BU23DRAFT_634144 [Bimuria novae-zelandiae CBS 107.79]
MGTSAGFGVIWLRHNGGDLHESSITADDTALVIIYTRKPADFSTVNGTQDGWIFENIFQEIDIESGELVFEWNASTHVGLNETYKELSDAGNEDSPFAYFHMNSVEKDANGDYIISARGMDCVYKISRDDGSVIWRLGGRQSDFALGEGVAFDFQHDAGWVDDAQTRMTLFDNGAYGEDEYSRGLLLDVDQDDMTVSLVREFINGATFGQFMGGLQLIEPSNDSSNFFLGYGSEPFFAEFDSEGDLLLDTQFGASNVVNNYRAYETVWQGKPLTNPDIHFDGDGSKAYLSWNGATDVEHRRMYTANATNGYIRARAVNGSGNALGWTQATEGNELFDASGDVSEDVRNTASSTSGSASSIGSTAAQTGASATAAEPSSSPTGAAVTAERTVVEKVIIAVVAVGGLALI